MKVIGWNFTFKAKPSFLTLNFIQLTLKMDTTVSKIQVYFL